MIFAMGDDLSYGLNTLGPLCLWQCLLEHYQIQTLNMLNVYMVTLIIQSVCVEDCSVDPE